MTGSSALGYPWLPVVPSAVESSPEAEQMALSSLKLELAALKAVSKINPHFKIKGPALGVLFHQQKQTDAPEENTANFKTVFALCIAEASRRLNLL